MLRGNTAVDYRLQGCNPNVRSEERGGDMAVVYIEQRGVERLEGRR